MCVPSPHFTMKHELESTVAICRRKSSKSYYLCARIWRLQGANWVGNNTPDWGKNISRLNTVQISPWVRVGDHGVTDKRYDNSSLLGLESLFATFPTCILWCLRHISFPWKENNPSYYSQRKSFPSFTGSVIRKSPTRCVIQNFHSKNHDSIKPSVWCPSSPPKLPKPVWLGGARAEPHCHSPSDTFQPSSQTGFGSTTEVKPTGLIESCFFESRRSRFQGNSIEVRVM